MSNAVKFTPKNGHVEARLERNNSHLEIVVSDTGRGIEAGFLPHVFDRFRQSDGSITRRHGGLGLWLAIVRQLAEMHGGTVAVESSGEDQGTIFRVSFPILSARSEPGSNTNQIFPAARSENSSRCSPELDGLDVLVVDDETDSRDLLFIMLDTCGARVTVASSATEAFEFAQQTNFNVIISDIGMPKEDGFSLVRKIRQLPGGKGAVPAIALTAYARNEDRIESLRAGFQMHFPKPVDNTELITAVANLSLRSSINETD